MKRRRVVVTGMGVVAPSGVGIENFWDSLIHGHSGIRKITHFDASSYPCQVAAEVRDFDPMEYMDSKTARRLARFAQFALAASRMAVEESALDLKAVEPLRMGVIVGTGIGGGEVKENQHSLFLEKGVKRLNPFAALMICTHSAAGIISCELGLKGVNTTIASGCNSGLDAIYTASNAIRAEDAEVMLAAVGEAPITPFIVGLFCAGGILAKNNGEGANALRPFDANGSGTVLGEGGAALVLEELEHALRRKAKIYGEILGYGSTHEAYSLYDIDTSAEAPSAVLQTVLANAHLKAADIHYICAHGNGMLRHDLNETRAIKRVFGESAYRIPVTSIKPITGQGFSVTGILQMITCLLVINRSVIPPTLNHHHPQSDCDLDYVPNHFRRCTVDKALMNARGFGGSHTAVIAGKFL